MACDELWNIRSTNDLWICPCCLSAIAKRPGLSLVDSVARHLENCRSFAMGKGATQPRDRIVERQVYENLIHAAQSDPAWKVYDHDGVWISPHSLQRVPTVRTQNGKLDNFLFQAIARHLSQCQFYRQGMTHTVDEVMLARELHRRVPEITRYVAFNLATQDAWRWIDAYGSWICPFTLFAVPQVQLATPGGFLAASESIALHLITHCPRFATGQLNPHPDALLASAAGPNGRQLPAPAGATPTPVSPTQILGTTTRTGLAILSPTPTANAINRGVGPAPALTTRVANPMTRGQTPPMANPVARPPSNVWDIPAAQRVSPATRQSGTPTTPIPSDSFTAPVARPLTVRQTPVPTIAPPARINTPLPTNAPARINSPLPTIAPPFVAGGDESLPFAPAAPAGTPASSESDQLDWMDAMDAQHNAPGVALPNTDMIHARRLQEKLLPQAPTMPGFQFAARFEPCADITGDFFVFITLPNGKVGMALGDVSGHGVQAGLIMSMAKKTIEIYAAQDMGPADTLSRVNDALVADLGGRMFISMVYGVLDPSENIITWARAGHNPGLRYNVVSELANEIRPRGMVVGMKSGAQFRQSMDEEITRLESGDVFLLYTDGITETMNLQHEEFGPERLADVLKQFAGDGPDVVVDQIMERMRHFRGPRPAADDATMVALLVE